VGIIGCILPILPGPPLSYAGLLLLQLSSKQPFTARFLIIYALLTVLVFTLDYIIPVYGTKKFHGSRYGLWGSAVGLIIGVIFFPPLGIIAGPVAGAFVGELIHGHKPNKAVQAAFGSFLGFLTSTLIKLFLCTSMAYYYLTSVL
jgi:uncharacterized protein YqgC (DUF456 family)